MSAGIDRERRLDRALARLAAEGAPPPALEARVLADAAMVAAERHPAPAQRARPPRRGWLARLFARPAYGLAGAGAVATVALGIVVGYGLKDEDDPVSAGRLDAEVLSALSPLDRLEREVMASLDEDLLDPESPL